MTTEPIIAGDRVLHRPTGETWFVLGVNSKRGELCPAGWPHSIARVADCERLDHGHDLTDDERESRARMFPGLPWDD